MCQGSTVWSSDFDELKGAVLWTQKQATLVVDPEREGFAYRKGTDRWGKSSNRDESA
jgi:hypothetical protein